MNMMNLLTRIKAFILDEFLEIILIIAGCFVLIKLTDTLSKKVIRVIKPWKKKEDGEFRKRLDTLSSVIHYVISFVLIVTAILMILAAVGIQIGPLLAAAGVVGIAFGLGAQSLVKDIISGFFIFLEDQMRVGDVVEIAGKSGVVERMNFKFTILRDFSGNVHYVPNGEISVVTNMTKTFSRYVLDIGVAYRENVDEVMQVMREVGEELQNDPDYGDDIIEPFEIFGLDNFAGSALIIKARLTTKPIKQWRTAREYRRRLKMAFDARNIEIPFPHLTLYAGKDKDNQSPPLNIHMQDKQE